MENNLLFMFGKKCELMNLLKKIIIFAMSLFEDMATGKEKVLYLSYLLKISKLFFNINHNLFNIK